MAPCSAPVGRAFVDGHCDGDRDGFFNVPATTSTTTGERARRQLQQHRRQDIDDFDDLDETDVIGGNKFSSVTFEYRFPIAESVGLMGIVFFDMGNAFDETQSILSTSASGATARASACSGSRRSDRSQAFLGFPLDKLSVEESVAFEFSVGGSGLLAAASLLEEVRMHSKVRTGAFAALVLLAARRGVRRAAAEDVKIGIVDIEQAHQRHRRGQGGARGDQPQAARGARGRSSR